MDEETVEKVAEKIEQIASEKEIKLKEVLLFGSRAREDYNEESDVDLVLISKDFEEMDTPSRPKDFYLDWDYEKLPEPEFICFTPQEFNEKKDNRGFIAYTAARNGIEI